MAEGALKYAIEVHKKFKTYWPAWLPDERFAVGDYGELQRGIFFKRLGHVSECGISKQALKARRATDHDNLVFRSKGGVRVRLRGSAANELPTPHLPAGRVRARIAFETADASFLAAVGVKGRMLQSEQKLRDELRAKVEAGGFHAEHVVITEVLRAQSGHAFMSTEAGQEVMLLAEASAGPERLKLASLQGRLEIATRSQNIMCFDGTRGMTPLFRIMGFKVGRQIRDALRFFSRTRNVPRVRVRAIRGAPEVGTAIVIHPLPSQQLLIAPTGSRPFALDPSEFRPFAVEPTLIDPAQIDLLFPAQELLGAQVLAEDQGLLVGMLEGEPDVGQATMMRALGASPLVIEPLEGDPFLVNVPQGQDLTFEPSRIDFLEDVPAGISLEPSDPQEDPFSFDYVNFNEELAAAL